MTILEIEEAIATQLSTDITDLKIEPYPDRPEKYKLVYPKGVILIQFVGSKYTAPDFEDVIQDRDMQFMIIIGLRDLRTHEGVYAILEQVRKSLSGKVFEDSETGRETRKTYPVSERFISRDGQIWTYGIIFNISVRVAETDD